MANDKPELQAGSHEANPFLLTPDQQNHMDMMALGKRAIPVANALPEAFTKNGDISIADSQIEKAMAFAASRMTAEQLKQANYEADSPMRWIKAAGDNQHTRPAEAETAHQAKPAAANHHDKFTAKHGDTISQYAATVLHERDGHRPTQGNIAKFSQEIAAHNHSQDVNALKIGEVIIVPPLLKAQ